MPIYSVFSPDGKYVVAQAKQVEGKLDLNAFAIYDLADGRERTRLKLDLKRGADSFLWSPDSKSVLAIQRSSFVFDETSFSANFVVCDAADGHEIYRVSQGSESLGPTGGRPGGGMSAAEVSLDGKYLAIKSSFRRFILVCDAVTGKEIRKIQAQTGSRFAFSADGRRLAAADSKGQWSTGEIIVWDVASGEKLFSVVPKRS